MTDADRERVVAALLGIFDRLACHERVEAVVPGYGGRHRDLAVARAGGDPEAIELELLRIYSFVHGSGGAYGRDDRVEFERLGGYWCHAGGVEPLVLAGRLIGPRTRLVDYGAGNGLQGLLLQALYPHRSTTLVELGAPMIVQGRLLQSLLGIPEERVAWVHASIVDVPPREFDTVYLYRPVRPEGTGRAFYEMFAREAAALCRPLEIVSVADCLKDFLPPSFRILHDDGQVTLFSNRESFPGDG